MTDTRNTERKAQKMTNLGSHTGLLCLPTETTPQLFSAVEPSLRAFKDGSLERIELLGHGSLLLNRADKRAPGLQVVTCRAARQADCSPCCCAIGLQNSKVKTMRVR